MSNSPKNCSQHSVWEADSRPVPLAHEVGRNVYAIWAGVASYAIRRKNCYYNFYGCCSWNSIQLSAHCWTNLLCGRHWSGYYYGHHQSDHYYGFRRLLYP